MENIYMEVFFPMVLIVKWWPVKILTFENHKPQWLVRILFKCHMCVCYSM